MTVTTFTAVTLFCEDAREEVGGTLSLTGIMPDNVVIERVPARLPKLSVYTRINFDPNQDPGDVEVILRHESGEKIMSNGLPRQLIEKTIQESKAIGNPLAGLISRLAAVNFPVTEQGRILAYVKAGDTEYLTGGINIIVGAPPGQG